jgi:hypothetical protein
VRLSTRCEITGFNFYTVLKHFPSFSVDFGQKYKCIPKVISLQLLRVVQPEVKSSLEARVEALEKKLNKHLEAENKDSGPAEIRTQDLRRVKATS